MKVLAILAAVAVTTSSAMAMDTVMGLKGRFDYNRTETKDAGTKTAASGFETNFLRLVADSKINETTTAKLTLDLQKADSASDNGISNLVDEAFLTKNIMGLSVMVGKQAVMTGGRENDYSSRDLYLTSTYKGVIADNLVGLSAGYDMAGQKIYLQYLEQAATTQDPLTDKKVLGLAYYGEFMNKMIMPILSYHKQGTSRPGAYDNYMSAGLRVEVASIMIEADYLMLEKEKTATGDAELNSIVAHVRYNHENFKPFAKFIKEDGKKGFTGIVTTAADKSERTAWELGLEYVPNKDEDMRYHVVYNSSESKDKSAGTKTEETQIVAGIAFNYNFLK